MSNRELPFAPSEGVTHNARVDEGPVQTWIGDGYVVLDLNRGPVRQVVMTPRETRRLIAILRAGLLDLEESRR